MSSYDALDELFNRGSSLMDVNSAESIKIFNKILNDSSNKIPEDDTKINLLKEKSIYSLTTLYSKSFDKLCGLLVSIRPFFNSISKAKTGKIMRTLIEKVELLNKLGGNYKLLISVCLECITWCKSEKRAFLARQIECKLCSFYLADLEYQKALTLVNKLIVEIKKLDDKHLLVEIHLVESRIHHSLHNIAKAKAALTASRAAGNSIYIPPLLQASIDQQAGCISSEEKDYKTAYSYFYEAFEGYDGLKDTKMAYIALQYMLLMKIMNDKPNDVNSVLSGKLAINYKSKQIDLMKNIATSYQDRSLHSFNEIIQNKANQEIALNDIVIKNKLEELKNKLLEENLLKLLEPFEVVEIKHIAELIGLSTNIIQNKLSQMILDKKFNGILDQGSGAIIVYDEVETNTLHQNAIQTIDVLNESVDQLFDKAKLLD